MSDTLADLHTINRDQAEFRLAALREADPVLFAGVNPVDHAAVVERVVEHTAAWTGNRDIRFEELDEFILSEIPSAIRSARAIRRCASRAESSAVRIAQDVADVAAIRRDLRETGDRLLADARRRLAEWSARFNLLAPGVEAAAPAQRLDIDNSATGGTGRPEETYTAPDSVSFACATARRRVRVRRARRLTHRPPRFARARPGAERHHEQARAPP